MNEQDKRNLEFLRTHFDDADEWYFYIKSRMNP